MVGTRLSGFTQNSAAPATLTGSNVRIEKKLDLCFPVTRITRHMRELKLADRISVKAGVAVTTLLEYMTAEMLTISGAECQHEGKMRIVPRHIRVAVNKDTEMLDMIGTGVVIPITKPAEKPRRHAVPDSS